MGLDIKFNLEAAMDAGLEVTTEVNGTPKEIEEESTYTNNEEYLAWLKSEAFWGKIKNYPNKFRIDTFEEFATVRANKWGKLYEPLTAFLVENNITFEEY